MRSALLLVLVAGCAKPADTAFTPDSAATAQLGGTWRASAMVMGGKPVSGQAVLNAQTHYIFEGDTFTIRSNVDAENKGKFQVDPTTEPKRIVFDMSPPMRGTFRIDGDTLTLCLMMEPKAKGFPPSLESAGSPATDVLTLKKDKAK